MLACVVAVVAYCFMARGLLAGDSEQNFTTWILWGVLDGIAAATIFFQSGSWAIPAVYAVGSTATAFLILKSGTVSWTWFDTMIICMVVACMVIWKVSGARTATIASTVAVTIAGIPQLVETWKKPEGSPFPVYLMFVVGNSLATAGAKSWSVEERLYPAVCIALTTAYLLAMSRKFLPSHQKAANAL